MTVMSPSALVPVYTLALSAFIFNTSEFVPVALLSDIGADFLMSNDKVGLMLTVYAWVVALLSLPLMLLTAKMDRKKLLMGVFLLFVIAHAIAFVAQSFWVLLLSRVLVATAHAIFWSITPSLVVRVAPTGYGTKALGLLATGGAIAMIVGLPLGRVIGQLSDWRVSFLAIGAIGVLVLMTLQKTLPALPSLKPSNLDSLPTLLKNRTLLLLYGLLFLGVTAHFTVYSYAEPLVLSLGFSPAWTTAILLLFGAAGVLASVIFGRYYDRLGQKLVGAALVVMTLGLGSLWFVMGLPYVWLVVAMMWATATTVLTLSLQMQILCASDDDKDVAMSLFSAIFNVGIGSGALVGSLVILGFGLAGVTVAGFLMMLVGGCFVGRQWAKSGVS